MRLADVIMQRERETTARRIAEATRAAEQARQAAQAREAAAAAEQGARMAEAHTHWIDQEQSR